jgi:hypothetical protein
MFCASLCKILRGLEIEIHCNGIAAADDDGDAFFWRRFMCTGQNGREGCDTARFGDAAQYLPQDLLSIQDRIFDDADDTMYVLFRNRKNALADPARRKRIRCNITHLSIDRTTGLQGLRQSRRRDLPRLPCNVR